MLNYSDIQSIKYGDYSAVYFERAQTIAAEEQREVTMQVFQRKDGTILAGTKLVKELFEKAALDYDSLDINMLPEGTELEAWEPVMKITGPYYSFAHLESVYLGILARCSRVATNTRRVVEAANGKPVMFFADRFDVFETQPYDGYAAYVGGIRQFATEAMVKFVYAKDIEVVGTMPHALIAYFNGSIVQACQAFVKHYPEVPLTALIDFNNNCTRDAALAASMREVKAVRIDTSSTMVDASLLLSNMDGDFDPTGVNPKLVENVRKTLDYYGRTDIKIVVSGGFTAEKIAKFEKLGVPVDAYGVGSSLLDGKIDFTADIVRPVAKAGRRERKMRNGSSI